MLSECLTLSFFNLGERSKDTVVRDEVRIMVFFFVTAQKHTCLMLPLVGLGHIVNYRRRAEIISGGVGVIFEDVIDAKGQDRLLM